MAVVVAHINQLEKVVGCGAMKNKKQINIYTHCLGGGEVKFR